MHCVPGVFESSVPNHGMVSLVHILKLDILMPMQLAADTSIGGKWPTQIGA